MNKSIKINGFYKEEICKDCDNLIIGGYCGIPINIVLDNNKIIKCSNFFHKIWNEEDNKLYKENIKENEK
jgi:hypothetical protein